MLDTAFEALKSYDWGTDMAVLAPIEEAATKTGSDPTLREDLEKRLIAALENPLSRDAQDYVCRKLATVASTAAIPVLSKLLLKDESSHMARFALERIPNAEASAALRDALTNVSDQSRIGIISSLGTRRDEVSVKSLAGYLSDRNLPVAKAAAIALGAIGSTESAAALRSALGSSASGVSNSAAGISQQAFVTDALLSCAEALLGSNHSSDATSIYQLLSQDNRPRLVRLAATRGLLACASRIA